MPGPSYMAHELRGAGSSIARLIRGGVFAEFLGSTGVTGAKDAASTGLKWFLRNTMVRYRGQVYASNFDGANVLHPITGLWSQAHAYTAPVGFTPGDMRVVDTPSGSFLIAVSNQNTTFMRYNKFDGTSWTGFIGAAKAHSANSKSFFHKGILYSYSPHAGGNLFLIDTFDPVTDAITQTSVSTTLFTPQDGSFFSLDDRLFIILAEVDGATANAQPAQIWEFRLGAWVFTGINGASYAILNGGTGLFVTQGAAYFFGGSGTAVLSGVDALLLTKITVPVPGGPPVAVELTAPIPGPLQVVATIGTPEDYRLHGIVDTVSVPGSETAYLLFYPDSTVGAIPTLLRFVDDVTPMVAAASPQHTGTSGPPDNLFGGGESFDGLSIPTSRLVTTSPEGTAQGTNGMVKSFSAWGDPIRIPHDGSGPAFTEGLVVTQAPSGATATVLFQSATELWVTQDSGTAWVNGQAITDSGAGSAVQNGAQAGGAADKTVVARFHLGAGQTAIGVPITGICTVVPGSVTGGGGAVEVGNTITNVTADGRTFSFEWDFLADGIPQASIANVQVFISRP